MKITINRLKNSRQSLGIGLVVTDALFFGFTNPAKVVSPLLIVGFFLVSATLFYTVYTLLSSASEAGLSIGSRQRKAALGGVGVVALLIALQSVGQLSTHDVSVVIPFVVIAYIYLTYGQSSQEP